MSTQVTLISPPDIFQNNEHSIMLMNVTPKEEDEVALWLTDHDTNHINIYFYQGEANVPWILHSMGCTNYKYINLDNLTSVTIHLAGYILSKQDVFYYTDDVNTAELYSHINANRVKSITDFLDITSGKK